MIRHECPHCHNVLQIPDQYAGQQGSCKRCGSKFIVPSGTDPFAAQDLENLHIDVDKVAPPPIHHGGEGNEHSALKLTTQQRTAIGCCVLFVLVFGIMYSSCVAMFKLSPEEQRQRNEEREHERLYSSANMAYIVSQNFVKKQLKAPSTAKFPFFGPDSSREIEPGLYAISGHCDTQNAFGAMIRVHYQCKMRYIAARGAWDCEDLVVLER